MTAIFRLPYLVAMMSELLKQIQNGRLAIDELDHFYLEAKLSLQLLNLLFCIDHLLMLFLHLFQLLPHFHI